MIPIFKPGMTAPRELSITGQNVIRVGLSNILKLLAGHVRSVKWNHLGPLKMRNFRMNTGSALACDQSTGDDQCDTQYFCD